MRLERSGGVGSLEAWITPGGLVVALGVFGASLARLWPFTIDDAFIVLRYGQNLVRHGRYAYNPSGDVVEGVTSITWTWLAAFSELMGADDPVLLKVAGTVLGLATIVAVAWCRWEPAGTPGNTGARDTSTLWRHDRLVAAIALAGYQPWALWSVGGLETSMAGLVVLGTLGAAVRTRRLGWAVTGAAIALMTRPDLGLVWVGVGLAPLARSSTPPSPGTRPDHSPDPRRAMALVAVAGAIVIGGLTAWRWACFDALVPNTALIKAGNPLGQSVLEGVVVAWGWLRMQGMGVVVGLGVVAAALGGKPVRIVAGVVLLFWAYVVSTGNPDMGFGYRFYLPMVPVTFSLAGHGVGLLRQRFGARAGWLARGLFCLPLVTAPWASDVLYERPDPTFRMQHSLRQMAAAELEKRRFGEMLDDALPANAVIATSDAGAIAYYARRQNIDLFGLNERSLALAIRGFSTAETAQARQTASRTYLEDVMGRRIDAFVQTGIPPVILNDRRFRRCYARADTEPFWFIRDKGLRLELFVRVCPPAAEVPPHWLP